MKQTEMTFAQEQEKLEEIFNTKDLLCNPISTPTIETQRRKGIITKFLELVNSKCNEIRRYALPYYNEEEPGPITDTKGNIYDCNFVAGKLETEKIILMNGHRIVIEAKESDNDLMIYTTNKYRIYVECDRLNRFIKVTVFEKDEETGRHEICYRTIIA